MDIVLFFYDYYFTLFYLEKSLNLLWFAFHFVLIHPQHTIPATDVKKS